MNVADIQERFIRAAEIERATPGHIGPAQPHSVDLGYVHDWIDKIGWGSKRLEEERREFWERLGLLPSVQELSELEVLRAWLLAVTDPRERRALLAWARSKAGGGKFNKWCFKTEHIHPETGRRRKDRAISRIYAHIIRSDVQNYGNVTSALLPEGREIGDLSDNMAEDAGERKPPRNWSSDDAFSSFITDAEHDFSWADKRNERRRQREARKRKKANSAA